MLLVTRTAVKVKGRADNSYNSEPVLLQYGAVTWFLLLYQVLGYSVRFDITEEIRPTAGNHNKDREGGEYPFSAKRQGVTLMNTIFHTLNVMLMVTGCGARIIPNM